MKTLILVVLLLSATMARAESTCTNSHDFRVHPCVDFSHMVIGAAVGGIVAYNYGPRAGMYSVLAFGVLKEGIDHYAKGKKFYGRDIATRALGGIIGIQIAIEFQ